MDTTTDDRPGDIQFRRVDVSDYDDVIAIRRGVYNGLDYLPTLYRTLLNNHVGYAASCNGELVAFEFVTFVDDGETMVTRALRVSKDHEGKGLVRHLKAFIDQSHQSDTNIKRRVYTADNKSLLGKVEAGKAAVTSQTDAAVLQGCSSKIVSTLPAGLDICLKILQKSDFSNILKSKLKCDKLFPQGRLLVSRVPYRLLESNIDHFFDETCVVFGSSNCDEDGVSLLTIGVGYLVPAGVRYSMDIYGEFSDETLHCHITEHLRRCTRLGSDTITFLVFYQAVKHDIDTIKKVMDQSSMSTSDIIPALVMYGIEEPFHG